MSILKNAFAFYDENCFDSVVADRIFTNLNNLGNNSFIGKYTFLLTNNRSMEI